MVSHDITPGQIKLINVMLTKQGIKEKEDKEFLLSVWSGHRTRSMRDLSKFEASKWIKNLISEDSKTSSADKMRKKILSMAHEMGWELEGTKRIVGTQKQAKIDMNHVNDWCIKFGYLHKNLDEYTYEELPKLVSQFEGAYKAHLNKV